MRWFQNPLKWIDAPSKQKTVPKIGFFKAYPWHSHILKPLAIELFSKADLCIASHGRQLMAKKLDIIIVADAGVIPFLRKQMPQAIYIHICHGLISKNQPFYNYSHADYICVSSSYIAERLTKQYCHPQKAFWPIGLPFMDTLSYPSPSTCFSSDKPLTLLYAPTWNPSLSSAEILSPKLVEYLRGSHEKWSILIKPHPHSFQVKPEWISNWSDISQKYSNVYLLDEDQDLSSYISKADAMISDTSSAPFLFLAVNRPILLIRNPQSLRDSQAYDPQGIEWEWSDMAYEISSPSEIHLKIAEIFSQGDVKRQIREKYREKLFGNNLDGHCTKRIAEKILELTKGS